jgi:NTP pyrophosphatase (non-canonical NTP hydrolase)
MTFDEYQIEAAKTDKQGGIDKEGVLVPLLGLAGEVGSLLTLYKKWLRDGDSSQIVGERIGDELGDILWYLATAARLGGINLSDIAERNLQKTRTRWLPQETPPQLFDEGFPITEQLPREFVAEIRDYDEGDRKRTELIINGAQVGNHLTNNAYTDDGYRFHDVFHLSYAVLLGWSPVLRANLRVKRKSNAMADEIEDGGRAVAIEEGICALLFSYAQEHSFLEGVSVVDWSVLRTCQEMAAHLEVATRTLYEWEQAILCGYTVWRAVKNARGGTIKCNLADRGFTYAKSALIVSAP